MGLFLLAGSACSQSEKTEKAPGLDDVDSVRVREIISLDHSGKATAADYKEALDILTLFADTVYPELDKMLEKANTKEELERLYKQQFGRHDYILDLIFFLNLDNFDAENRLRANAMMLHYGAMTEKFDKKIEKKFPSTDSESSSPADKLKNKLK